MKIAVAYENGDVFQHFGHARQFKLYEVRESKVLETELLDTDGYGHEALATLLERNGVDLLICGGIGAGAEAALKAACIVICPGVSGKADDAVAAFLRGELRFGGANCDHHGEGHDHEAADGCGTDGSSKDGAGCGEDHEAVDGADGCGADGSSEDGAGCGCGAEGCGAGECGSDCGSGCGGCAGCGARPVISGKNVGKRCKTHYRGTFNDGTVFDSSYDRGEPLEFICGVGRMIPGFDAAVANMEVGETLTVHLMPEEAYGPADPEAIFAVELAALPGAEALEVGQAVLLTNYYGQPFRARVAAKDEKSITFDANHEMAGKELNFTIELLEAEDAD